MKKTFRTFLLCVSSLFITHSLEAKEKSIIQPENNSKNKVLIVYFSHTGTTKKMAEEIRKLTNGDIFEIIPLVSYPTTHRDVVDQAQKEINAQFKPKLKTTLDSIKSYDVIFVGSPNWWHTFAPPIATFLTSHDFSGKKIVPFITHRGSEMGSSESDIKKLCPKSTLLKGLPIHSNRLKRSTPEIKKWLIDIKVIADIKN